jgi:chaperone modulatory protein CbpM
MSAPSRPRRVASIDDVPRQAEIRLSGEQLATAAQISVTRLVRLIHLGIVEPVAPGSSEFTAATAARLRRMLRLRSDLGVNLAGAAIIVDLLERLDGLEQELSRLNAGARTIPS